MTGLTISSAVTGPLSLTIANNPLTITSAGSVKTTASGADAIDGASGIAWTVNNAGAVSSSQHFGIALRGAGSSINNSGSISGYGGSAGYGVELDAGGTLTNTSAGYITGGEDGIIVNGAAGTINNSGRIVATFDDGVSLFAGGSVVNNAGGVIQAPTSGGYGPAGVYIAAGSASVVNHGTISGQYGVYYGVAGTVENGGTISGTSYAVDFAASSSANRLIVDPGAVFNGLVSGGKGTLELAAGSGAAGTLSGTIGRTTGSFENFSQLVVDSGAVWKLSAALQITTIQLNGSLEVASDTTSSSQINFASGAKLTIDNAASFSGPVLSNFIAGDVVDIHNFSATGAKISYNASTGVARISNGSQTATLHFKASTLGAGVLQVASDAGTGIDVTVGSSSPPAAPTIAGTVANQPTTSEAPVNPFSKVTVGDANANATDTLTITLSGAGGTLTGANLSGGANGVYTLTGTAALVTSELDALLFTPTIGAPGTSSSTAFSLSDKSSAYATPTVDNTTSVVDTDPASTGSGLTVSTAITGPLTLTTTNSPLTIASTGSVETTASGADAIDGGSGTAWTIYNSGTVSSSKRYAVSLHSAGDSIVNSGTMSGNSGSSGYGLDLEEGGTVTNTSTGYISGGEDAIFVYNAAATINNSGEIVSTFDDGIGLFAGGSVVNNASGVIQTPTGGGYGPAGVYIPAGSASVVNHGSISGQYGVYYSVAGTVENSGTISGTSYAVEFAASSSVNRLIVDPGAVFNGAVNGNGGVLELSSGAGSIGSIGSSSFNGFQQLVDDSGGDWTLTGSNAIANATDNGSLIVAGSLDVSSAVNSSSTGQFDIQAGATLELAVDTATNSQIDFLGSGQMTIDNAASFGINIGQSAYAGPLIENFVAGDTIDIHGLSATAAQLLYNPVNGMLEITNGSGQVATLDFQKSTLGTGAFSFASDGNGGIKIMI